MALLPNMLGLNIGQLSSLAAAVTLLPQLIPIWGFLKLPDRQPEAWRESSRIAKIFSSKSSRILFCTFCSLLMGVFIVLNVMTFTKTTAVLCVGYFVLAIVVCWGFGDRLMAKGAQRLLEKENVD